MDEVIKLNVGGTYFSTTRATLCADVSSMLACKFDPESSFAEPLTDSEGCPFLDLNPAHFQWTLDYLRYGCKAPQNLPDHLGILNAIKRDADYLSLHELVSILEVKIASQAQHRKQEGTGSTTISSFKTVTKVRQTNTTVTLYDVMEDESREWAYQGYGVNDIQCCVAKAPETYRSKNSHWHYTTVLLEKKV